MADRKLSADEVAALGLDGPAPTSRKLSAEEVSALGLDSASSPKAETLLGSEGAGSFVRGAAQGGTLGFADELGGAMQGGLQHIANGLPTGALEWAGIDNRYLERPGEVYRAARDENRLADKTSQQAAPGMYLAGEIGGGLATLAAAPAAAGFKGAVKAGSLIGAGSGLGSSEADLTRGEFAGAGVDAGLGMAGGATFGAGGYGAGKAAAWARNKVLSKTAGFIDRATRDAGEQAAKKAAADLASANGAIGGQSSAAMRALEHMERILTDELAPAAQKEQARIFLASAEGRALIDSARQSVLDEAPRILGRLKGSQELRGVAKAATSEGALVGATDEILSDPVGKQLVPRLKTMASRAVPAAVASYVGNQIDGGEGAAIGGALGLGASMIIGRPGTAMANAIKSPAVRKGVGDLIQWTLKTAPDKLGEFAGPLQKAVGRGPEQFAVTHFVMQQQNPAYRKVLMALDPDSTGAESEEMASLPPWAR